MSDEITFSRTQSTYGSYVLSVGGHSVKGSVRAFNNDTLWCGEGLIIVADGTGAAESAGIAARTAVEVIQSQGREKTGVQYTHRLDHVVKIANEIVYENAQRAEIRMATTCTALRWYEEGERIFWELAHVGDSRAYRANFRRMEWRKLTVDHANNGHLIRAIGRYPEVEVEYQQGILEHEDLFIMCSDGVGKGMNERDVVETIAETVKNRKDPEAAAKRTNNLALMLNDCDNCTTAVLYADYLTK